VERTAKRFHDFAEAKKADRAFYKKAIGQRKVTNCGLSRRAVRNEFFGLD
jgi:hypothetical protein